MITYWGLAIFVIGIVGFYILRNRARDFAIFLLWVSGVGFGIVIGGILFYVIATSAIDRIFGS